MRLAVVAVPLVLMLEVSRADAAPPSDTEVSRRLAFIEARLARGAGPANMWWSSWYYGWTALSMGQFVWAIATPDKGTRIDMAVGAAASTLGVIPLGVLPFPARTAQRDLARVPARSPEERRRKLAFAEHLLEAAAKDQKLRRSWVNHATSIGVSIGVGLVLGVGYGRPIPGLINSIGGIALSELQIWTQPTAAITDFADYEKLRNESKPSTTMLPPKTNGFPVSISIAPHPGGISISGSF
ncbi:MAG: hypothetical protein IPM54_22580 [Polyangiaceae bacterium]|nr:hypothetical protein [Polyangiaceae bacterium]